MPSYEEMLEGDIQVHTSVNALIPFLNNAELIYIYQRFGLSSPCVNPKLISRSLCVVDMLL